MKEISIAQRFIPAFFIAALSTGCKIASAQESPSFTCEVRAVGSVQADGTLKLIKKGERDFLAEYLGTRFSVNKNSGAINGSIVSNQSPNVVRTRIVDPGGSQQSLKVLSEFGPNPSILYLQFDEYTAKSVGGSFPFSGFRWQEHISGICYK